MLATTILRRELHFLHTPTIDVHALIEGWALDQEFADSLRANRIDPKFLYVTPRQTELWRQVFLKHSPIHTNPEFARIYHDAFAQIAGELPPGKVALIGLGCGTGLKELDLYSHLKTGREVQFAAIDVSRDLAMESAQKLMAAGATHERSLVCDLAHGVYIADWLDRSIGASPRVITFFGLVPNLAPSLVIRLFQALLRPGDILLASAHLAPVGERTELSEAMQTVLPQYDNPETLVWLTAALKEQGIKDQVEPPEMKIGEMEGFPAFVATARWKSGGAPLQLFHSLRYTPELFEKMLCDAGFELSRVAMTSCREEAIWAIRQRS